MTQPSSPRRPAEARFAGVRATHAVECVDVLAEPERIAAGGWWAVVGEFDGRVRAWRFEHVDRSAESEPAGEGDDGWRGPDPTAWTTSMDRETYVAAVAATREAIREGEVYQANICRILRARLARDDDGAEPAARALADRLARANPAPYAGMLHVPAGGAVDPVWIVSASPELFVRIDGTTITSGPIKGTAREPSGLSDKDRAENVMITDLVRNDLQRVCDPGTVDVTALLAVEHHPGLVHLVSIVSGTLREGLVSSEDAWPRILEATYPPGSVSGAPKSSALRTIAELEIESRGPYCGAFGWIDADAGTAQLAVAIRTFWWDGSDGGSLRFGTGAGITWGSTPEEEWEETELKARRLVALASSGTD